MTPTELAEMVRVAYDPAAEAPLAELRAAGEDPGVTWDTAGPSAQFSEWGSMTHDSGVSVTWHMAAPPSGAVQSNVLTRLLAPHPALPRKRVTLVYRPYPAVQSAQIADAQVRTAIGLASATKGATKAGDSLALEQARQTAQEQASGAGLTRVSMLVTATVTDPAQVPAAVEAVDQLAGSSRVRLRRSFGSQSAAFAAALGVGVVLPRHVYVPESVHEFM
jgi:hypothetical protein